MQYALWEYPVHFLAYGLGAGLSPWAPGTAGTCVAVVLLRAFGRLSAARYAVTVVALGLAGILICDRTARSLGLPDPGVIVWDEIVGYLVAMFRLPTDVRWMLAGFAVFRLLDVVKPFPADRAEHLFGVGGGIMADDIVAGLYTFALLHLGRWANTRRLR